MTELLKIKKHGLSKLYLKYWATLTLSNNGRSRLIIEENIINKMIRITPMLAVTVGLLFSCTEERFIYDSGNLVPKTVDQDLSLPSITVNNAVLHSEAFGHPDSSMIVCIHGGPGSDYRYMLNSKDLADYGYRVVFYDQRGSGLSQRFSKKSYTNLKLGVLDVLYNELSGVINHYRTKPDQKIFLLGHSWGGMLATGYTGRYPTAIQGLAVCEPGGLKWNDTKKYLESVLSFNVWSEMMNDVSYLDQFITGKEDEHEILDYRVGVILSEMEKTGDVRTEPASFWRGGAVINSALAEIGEDYKPDFSNGISNFEVPVLFFYSEKNEAYGDLWAQKVSSAYNSVELFKINGVGHDDIIKDKTAWREQTLPKMLTYFNSLNN